MSLPSIRSYIADLDGDHLVDVLLANLAPSVDNSRVTLADLQAIRGIDGQILWRQMCSLVVDRDEMRREQHFYSPMHARDACPIEFGDLDADGAVSIVLVNSQGEVQSLSGLSGEIQSSWSIPDFTANSQAKVCLADVDGNKRLEICVLANCSSGFKNSSVLIILEDQGRLREQLSEKQQPGRLSQLQATDLDGNGDDELLILRDTELRVFDDGLKQLLWNWTPDFIGSDTRLILLETVETKSGNRVLLATDAYNADRRTGIFALDGSTGKPVWEFRVPSHLRIRPRFLLNDDDAPSCLFTAGSPADVFSHSTIYRAAWPGKR